MLFISVSPKCNRKSPPSSGKTSIENVLVKADRCSNKDELIECISSYDNMLSWLMCGLSFANLGKDFSDWLRDDSDTDKKSQLVDKDELEEIVHQLENDDNLARPTGEKIGHIEYRTDLLNQYIEFVISTCSERFDGMKVVLDCSNGAAYEVMPKVLRELGAKVKVIHALPNGVNINDNCGSTHMESLQKAVVENNADFGIAHDGDADRCLCVDEKGQIIDGDHILVMCAQDMIKKGTLPHKTVVSTVMANIGFHKAIKEAGGRVEVTQVGDRYVLENMLKSGYKIGGEQSGHIIFTDYSTTGDGPITALQVLSSLKRSGRKASELTALMTTYPQLLVNVRVATKEGWEKNEAISAAIAKGEAELGNDGRILVRPSGTEPLIRVMAEGPDQAQLDRICNEIADVVKKEQG